MLKIVNMIPNSWSDDENQDCEPNLSVNPANPNEIIGTAFTYDNPAGSSAVSPAMSGNWAPLFYSTDGGDTWGLQFVIPSAAGDQLPTWDVTCRYGGTSGEVYSGLISPGSFTILINRAADAVTQQTNITSVTGDQPFLEATTVLSGSAAGKDRLYVGYNQSGNSSTVNVFLDATASAATTANSLDVRFPRDMPPTRTAVHSSGTIYCAFYSYDTSSTGTSSLLASSRNVVVVKDVNWAATTPAFQALVDGGDGKVGVRVAISVSNPWFNSNFLDPSFGNDRYGPDLAIAVDPNNADRVYIVYATGTVASDSVLHLRWSKDGGQSWSADVRSVPVAKNPSLAINSQGMVGFAYQQVVGSNWVTVLEVSDNGFTSGYSTHILASTPTSSPTPASLFATYLGDYIKLLSVGTDFYGTFCASNAPVAANFPSGVKYQRNVNWTTQTLLANDDVTPVAVSIDPFFFRETEVGAGDDFYVRDWTDSPSSGDTGLEPSTHPVFYATSDVWNRRGSLPGSFPNDQPSNEDAGNGTGNIGDNWAFARVRRNVTGTAATVTAHFLVSKFGTGSNYVDSSSGDADVSLPTPDPTIAFAASDVGPFITPAYQWHLGAISSTHLCLAVEISTPADPFVAPSLVGRAPGWPTTDLAVIDDNNKAQRNMGLSTTPARGVGMSDDLFAWIHNPATFRRDLILRMHADPAIARRLAGARVQIGRAHV